MVNWNGKFNWFPIPFWASLSQWVSFEVEVFLRLPVGRSLPLVLMMLLLVAHEKLPWLNTDDYEFLRLWSVWDVPRIVRKFRHRYGQHLPPITDQLASYIFREWLFHGISLLLHHQCREWLKQVSLFYLLYRS